MLDKFFRFIGFWPIGSVVALNNGNIALVRDQNESDFQRPIIEIVSPLKEKRQVDAAHLVEKTIQLNTFTTARVSFSKSSSEMVSAGVR